MATHTATSPNHRSNKDRNRTTNVDRRANKGRKQTKPYPLLVGPDTIAMVGTDKIQTAAGQIWRSQVGRSAQLDDISLVVPIDKTCNPMR